PVEGHTGVKYSLDEALMDSNWFELLKEYSKLSGSIDDSANLLPSLSPFAKEMAKWTKATCVAGLWELDGQIPFRSLLWYSTKKNRPAGNGMDHSGFRFEWIPPKAAIQHKAMTYHYTDSQIEVLSVKADLATSNTFGQVRGGELRIIGLVLNYEGADMWEFAVERRKDKKSKQSLCFSDIPDGEPTMTRKFFACLKRYKCQGEETTSFAAVKSFRWLAWARRREKAKL
ncbi:MAG: hypothetical protein Q9224_007709, partial [Gallowayella concinna]